MQGVNTLHTCCVSKSMRLPGEEAKTATAIMAARNGNLRRLNSSGPVVDSPIRPGSPQDGQRSAFKRSRQSCERLQWRVSNEERLHSSVSPQARDSRRTLPEQPQP